MRRALIYKLTNRLCQVELQDFPVHRDLEWRDCANDVTPETHDFDGSEFITKPPVPVKTADEVAAEAVSGLGRLLFEVNFNQENRVRALEGKTAITRVQYRDALIAFWKGLG